ncbi:MULTISPECIES: hypothetical protein [unclassified Mesorhizobium]|uniref:hypothetical protein n=1 Tax=unclassified Mesorhizobium TaxID=325217 RepID=UPI002414EE26|nr:MULTISPECIES: hypothetical protein [unclassified Mesorhizobium]MDG4889470.1 hypothetical protein [Mesorhizobium sp. WSM4887]MDG4907678.1 hypothetical protein [Mesorhizobium sp. WSM4898]
MTGQTETIDSASKPEQRTRQRSTISFPYMDLRSAVAFADAIHAHVGTGECDDDQLAAWTSQSAKSSTFRVQVYTARMFGVLEGDGPRHRLTELGRQVVDPNQARAAKARAFLNVPLYRAVFDKYKGGVIPPAAALERDMVQLGVAEKQRDRARQAFERSADQAGFFEHGRNRLVQPGVIAGETPQQQPSAENGGNGGSGGGSGPKDPLIAALIQKLPQSGPWDAVQRVAWLNLMKMAFQLTYGAADEIEITVKPVISTSASQQPS